MRGEGKTEEVEVVAGFEDDVGAGRFEADGARKYFCVVIEFFVEIGGDEDRRN